MKGMVSTNLGELVILHRFHHLLFKFLCYLRLHLDRMLVDLAQQLLVLVSRLAEPVAFLCFLLQIFLSLFIEFKSVANFRLILH